MDRKRRLLLTTFAFLFSVATVNAQSPPLKLVQTIAMPHVKKGFDHFAADPEGHRLFVCTEWNNAIDVVDMRTWKPLHTITGLNRPHHIHYREDLDRIYIVDGNEETGSLWIFDGKSYDLLKNVPLSSDADWAAYDPGTKYLYVTQSGDDLKRSYSLVSIIDTTEGVKVDDMKIDGNILEGLAPEGSSPKIYLGNKAKNEVDVIDRKTREVIASWPLKSGSSIGPLALDEKNHRLFVGCRSGQIVIVDTITGKELQALPINSGMRDLTYDPSTRRLYANCGGPKEGGNGSVDVYEQIDADNYKSLGSLTTGPAARNGILLRKISRYVVAVPPHDSSEATLLVYEVR
jgi:DNA-binding beta-propeller fold protein YncE